MIVRFFTMFAAVAPLAMVAAGGEPARSPSAAAPAGARLLTVAGEQRPASPLLSISPTEVVFADGTSVPSADLRWIRLVPDAAPPAAAAPLIHLVGGGQLRVQGFELTDDALKIVRPDGRKASLNLDDVIAAQWAQNESPGWKQALAAPSQDHDLLVLDATPQPTVLRVFLEEIGESTVRFEWEKKLQSADRSRVVGVVFARSRAAVSSPSFTASLVDGSSIAFKELTAGPSDSEKNLRISDDSVLTVRSNELVQIVIPSPRLRFLSELPPSAVTEQPVLALPRSWQKDRNVRGERLSANGELFEHGIGVQAGTSMTWDLPPGALEFASIIQRTPPAGAGGTCEFVVLADDREIFRRSMTANSPAESIRVPLGQSARITLRVEDGGDLDLGDHANWCDAHLLFSR